MNGARYSVYRAGTDIPVCIYGTRVQCARAMKIGLKSFDSYASRSKHHPEKATRKWEIVKETD